MLNDGAIGSVYVGGAFHLPDNGMKRRVLVMKRAEKPETSMFSIASLLFELYDETRFSDARLAGYQNQAALAASRGVPATQQQLNLFGAADKRRHTAA